MGKQRDLKILFDSGDLDDCAELVWKNGEYIVCLEYYGNKVSPYSMPGFHVEVYYSPSEKRVFKIEPITDNEALNNFCRILN